jgi:hypothetical protein
VVRSYMWSFKLMKNTNNTLTRLLPSGVTQLPQWSKFPEFGNNARPY